MFDVPAAPRSRRLAPWRWLWQSPLALSALAVLASAFRPWMHISNMSMTACSDCNLFAAIVISLTGAASIYAGHFFTLPLCLMLSAWLGRAPSSRRHCGLQALALGAMLWWAALIFGAMEQLRNDKGIHEFDAADPLRGQHVFIAGMALMVVGLLVAAARLVWGDAADPRPAAPGARVAPLTGDD